MASTLVEGCTPYALFKIFNKSHTLFAKGCTKLSLGLKMTYMLIMNMALFVDISIF